MVDWSLRILDTAEEMLAAEDLQRLVWSGSDAEIVPAHLLIAAASHGGLVIGAFAEGEGTTGERTGQPGNPLIGFVFGIPGFYSTPDGPRLLHYSHMLGVHPDHRSQGIGFALKRAQWQMVRRQGIDRITWTYDPLLSRNAYLNISRLGAVCNTYRRNFYGDLRDHMNKGLDTDRFQVDWWVNSKRVNRRLSSRPRLQLDLAHFLAAGAQILNPTHISANGFPKPVQQESLDTLYKDPEEAQSILLVEIPSNFLTLKAKAPELAHEWRQHSRALFEDLFAHGYLVTDFIHLPGKSARSFYVLSHGESTL